MGEAKFSSSGFATAIPRSMETTSPRHARRRRPRWVGLSIGAVALGAAATVSFVVASSSDDSSQGSTAMVGTFELTAGVCNPVTGAIVGSYFKLIFPGGNVHTGYFFQNTSSRCFNKSFTTITPGTEGGLLTGGFQPAPTRSFTKNGDARAHAIIRPVSFAAIDLSLSTQAIDPQTKKRVPAPVMDNNGGRLSGNVEALSAEWRSIYFNQGSPKPGGHRPGLTQPVSGSYNVRTHAFTLDWTSKIVGGPFTGFIGQWHLAGKFVATN
jgi:hypothetical protein